MYICILLCMWYLPSYPSLKLVDLCGGLPYLYIPYCNKTITLIEGSLEVKLPTIWTDEKHSQEEAEPGRNAGARKGREVAKHHIFPVLCGSGGSKSRLDKAAGAETSGQMRHEKLHAIVARSTF